MTDALVLNARSSWAAFQVGALRYVVGERGRRFQLHAGTGIGAMNAAFVACGELPALDAWWRSARLGQLVRPAVRGFWRGPLNGEPQRRLIAAHVSEDQLAARGATLLVSTLDLRAGMERVWEYPGADLPLVDALMAAVATAGLIAPVAHGIDQLAEGTFVDSFLLRTVLDRDPDRVLAIAAASARPAPPRCYTTWRAVTERALALNLDHDIVSALEFARRRTETADAHRRAADALCALVDERVADPALASTLTQQIRAAHRATSAPPVTAILPSRQLDYPLWQFSRRRLDDAIVLGYADARAALEQEDAR
jgi:predicted acylesterase/phospholipase RssA